MKEAACKQYIRAEVRTPDEIEDTTFCMHSA